MSHRRSSSQPKTRTFHWSRATQSFLAQGAGSVGGTIITAGANAETIMRMHIELTCWIDAVQTPSKLVEVAVGALVMPEGQGATIVSEPVVDDSAPWFFYERFALGYEEYVTDVIDSPGLTTFRKTIDVKSMRILRPEREVQLVLTNTTILSAAAINFSMSTSVLFGQH